MKKLLILFLFLPLCVLADNDDILKKFLHSYNFTGDINEIITDNDSLVLSYDTHYTKFKKRHLRLENVRWSDNRITADYYSVDDGEHNQGSMTVFTKDNKILKIVFDNRVYKETENNLAVSGQVADKGTTVVGLASGTVKEMNPALAGAGIVGIAAAGVGLFTLQKSSMQTQSLGECVESSKMFGGFGWGAAGNNILAILGMGPGAIILGVGAGATAYNQEYKGSCVEGPIRYASLE